MTAIKASLDTRHLLLPILPDGTRAETTFPLDGLSGNYPGVLCSNLGVSPPRPRWSPRSDRIGHPHEARKGSRAHFAHGGASMNLDRDFAYPQVACDLFVHLAGRHQQHHLLFAWRKRVEPQLDLRDIVVHSPSLPIAFDCAL